MRANLNVILRGMAWAALLTVGAIIVLFTFTDVFGY